MYIDTWGRSCREKRFQTFTEMSLASWSFLYTLSLRQILDCLCNDSPEASLLVPDFTISVYGSSCNYDFFIMSLTALISLSMYSICIPNAGWDAKIDIDRESKVIRIRQKR